jgi:hypothetical protein
MAADLQILKLIENDYSCGDVATSSFIRGGDSTQALSGMMFRPRRHHQAGGLIRP